MDWADDAVNAVDDLEDAILANQITPALLGSRRERAAIAQLAADRITTETASCVEAAADDLIRLAPAARLLRHGYDGTHGSQTATRHLTGCLLRRLTHATVTETRRVHGADCPTRHHGDLVVPARARAEVAWLTALTLRHVLREPARRRRRQRQRDILAEVFDAVLRDAPATLPPAFAERWTTTEPDPERVRVVTDHLASLTEAQVISQYHRLCRGTPRTAPTNGGWENPDSRAASRVS